MSPTMRSAALALLTLSAACTRPSTGPSPSPATTADINARDLRLRLTAFAHDSMMGREAGTIWDAKAADWVAAQFQMYGLQPAGENGGFFQEVPDIGPRDTTTARAAAQERCRDRARQRPRIGA